MRMLKFWVYDGCLASAVSGPLDVFATANSVFRARHPRARTPLFGFRVESLDGAQVTSAAGLPIAVAGRIGAPGDCDAILLPGLYCGDGARQLIARVEGLRRLVPALRRAHAQRCLIAANCSAVFLLAEAGLLDGRPATTTWWLERAFRARYGEVALAPRALLTEQAGLICSGATTAYLNLALRIVERLGGVELAATCARYLLIDANRVSQAPYMTLTLQEHARHGDALVVRAQHWIAEHLDAEIGLERLAKVLAVSERTLIRRFRAALDTTPTGHIQTQRVEVAKGLLETSDLTVDDIAQQVGYTDVSSFRRLFTREVGVTPGAYRTQFARGPAEVREVARRSRPFSGSMPGATSPM